MADPFQLMEPGYGAGAADYRINRDDSAPNRSRRKYTVPPEQDGSVPTISDTVTVDFPNTHFNANPPDFTEPLERYPSTLSDITNDEMPIGYPGA